jgi:hypothetical protein
MRKKLAIVSIPTKKHYVIRSNDTEEITLIGDICISGSIVGIGNTYEEAEVLFNNLVG